MGERMPIKILEHGRLQDYDVDPSRIGFRWVTMETERWVSVKKLCVVTKNSVYHWSLDGTTTPAKIFDRHADTKNCDEIIDYLVDAEEKWMLVVGVKVMDGNIIGLMQLHKRGTDKDRIIQGHAAMFTSVMVERGIYPTKFFIYGARDQDSSKLHITEMDHREENPVIPDKTVDIFCQSEDTNDFPISIRVSKKYYLIFLLTKNGYVQLFDLETGICIYVERISLSSVFASVPDDLGGIVGVNRTGQILSVEIDEAYIITHIRNNLNNRDLAIRLARKNNLPGVEDLFPDDTDNSDDIIL
ncbi:5688_t:CDS:2 [Acaulospora colombiana]|uniref:5688_t:CDS:1 n=1 Tax=Acaulospora colombiana TaxID=27376 RepID=A0ACA9LMA2_9GLOM|nr:5688_t:CDS:2 [Acaulospora colombiana]